LLDAGRRWDMRKIQGLTCPRCGSADLELERADVNGETADETTVQRCRQCDERFFITAKRD
jgi:DNA-directed RNA polymerase subunit RPC12/RpoP